MPSQSACSKVWIGVYIPAIVALLAGGGLLTASTSAYAAAPAGAPSAPQSPHTADALIYLQPGTGGNCTAPANGGTVNAGCRFVLDMWVNAGSNAAPDGVTDAEAYLT